MFCWCCYWHTHTHTHTTVHTHEWLKLSDVFIQALIFIKLNISQFLNANCFYSCQNLFHFFSSLSIHWKLAHQFPSKTNPFLWLVTFLGGSWQSCRVFEVTYQWTKWQRSSYIQDLQAPKLTPKWRILDSHLLGSPSVTPATSVLPLTVKEWN